MAAEVVLGGLLEITITNLVSIVRDQVNLIGGLEDELQKLRDTLTMIQGVLEDAEQRQLKVDKAVNHWLLRLRDLAYEANDVLDEIAYENLRMEVAESQTDQQVRNLFCFPNLVTFRRKMGVKIKKLNVSLRNINSQAAELGLQHRLVNGGVPLTASSISETHSSLGETKPIGRDADVSKIVDMLVCPPTTEQAFSVVSIVGMGGLGKTTIAKLVYDDDLVKNHFDLRVWLCVSDGFDVKRILSSMLGRMGRSGFYLKTSRTKEEMLSAFKGQFVKKSSLLLILDDVWNEDASLWEDLRNCLFSIDQSTKSRILVTTRSEKVALKMDTIPEHIHHVQKLDKDKCWSIMNERITRVSPLPPDFEITGRRIAEKCGGVPLVAHVIGGAMSSNMNKDEWFSIQQSSLWGSLEDNEGILRTLKLSFDHWSSPCLKKCFLYCSVFPKDSLIDKNKLIKLWMAEGYLEPSEGRRMSLEDIGCRFFSALLSSSFFQDVERDVLGNITTVKMHDLIHDLAVSLSKSETIILDGNFPAGVSHLRHLRITDSGRQLPDISRGVTQTLHSLFSAVDVFQNMSMRFKRLRTLDLSEANVLELPSLIGKMKHLRYFDISGTKITSLPDSFTRLYNLQSFIFLKCRRLKRLPQRMNNLVRLKHLCFNDESVIMPEDIGHLTGLQTLSIFAVGEEMGSGIEVLGNFAELQGELSICRLDRVRDRQEAEKANLQHKSKLYKLQFRWSGRQASHANHEDVLEGLQPHPNLKSLTISSYMGHTFSPWLSTAVLDNLIKLELVCCECSEQLPSLGQLPNLEILRIQYLSKVESIESTFYYNGVSQESTFFPKLKSFELKGMARLEQWVDVSQQGVTAFPLLEELVIQGCSSLKSVPILGNLPSLLRLKIRSCSKLCSIGDGLSTSKNLSELRICGCSNLDSVSSIDGLSSLKVLELFDCKELNSLPDGLQNCTSLERLEIAKCPDMTCTLQCLEGLSSLSSLEILGCRQLIIAENSFSGLTRLKKLSIGGFSEEMEEFPPFLNSSMHLLQASLESLTLHGWGKLKSLPPQLQQLSALKELLILQFDDMEALPEWLGNLSSLCQMEILRCKNLMYLPSHEAMRRLSNLQCLYISACPRLQERCESCDDETGPEWSKVSHIPHFCMSYKELLASLYSDLTERRHLENYFP